MKKIETEVKLEVSAKEFLDCQQLLQESGFTEKPAYNLKDYFFNVEAFDAAGWNFLRIREYDGTRYERTEKIWKYNENGDRVRLEDERETDKSELDSLCATNKTPLTLTKVRTNYEGVVLGYSAVFSFDYVTFPDEKRYFVECEIDVPEDVAGDEFRSKLREWMLRFFNLSVRPEGIGMMALTLSKLGTSV